MRKVAFFEVAPYEREAIEAARFSDAETLLFAERLTPETASRVPEAEVVSVFVYSHVTPDLLARLPLLRFVSTRSTGYDHLDLEALHDRGVTASYVPSYGENTVAEHAFALIFALARRLPIAIARTRKGNFSIDGLEGSDLKDKTLGVVGVGRIGLQAIRIGRGAGMRVVAYDVRKNAPLAAAEGFRYVPFEVLLEQADVVSLHAALTPETFHLIDRAALKRMKPTALLVNTARGAIVDTAALCEALDAGWIAGAGLDVLEGEELLKDEAQLLRGSPTQEQRRTLALCHSLMQRENVVMTPHVAFFTREGVNRLVETSLANISAYLAGNPQNVIPGATP